MQSETPESKPWYKSKTVWFNAVVLVVSIASALAVDPSVKAEVGQVASYVLIAGNIALRLLSGQPIELPGRAGK